MQRLFLGHENVAAELREEVSKELSNPDSHMAVAVARVLSERDKGDAARSTAALGQGRASLSSSSSSFASSSSSSSSFKGKDIDWFSLMGDGSDVVEAAAQPDPTPKVRFSIFTSPVFIFSLKTQLFLSLSLSLSSLSLLFSALLCSALLFSSLSLLRSPRGSAT